MADKFILGFPISEKTASSVMFQDGTDVGIGTDSPDSKLEVAGGDLTLSKPYVASAYLDIIFNQSGYPNRTSSIGHQLDDTGNGGSLVLSTNANGFDATEKMRITSGGEVLISNSDARLNGGDADGRFIVSNSNTTSYISLNGSSNASPNDISIITDEEIIFNTGSTYSEAMRITSAGNVKFSSTLGTTLEFDRIDTFVTANEVIGKLDFKSTDTQDPGVNASIKVIKEDLATGAVPMAIIFETGISGTRAERMRIKSNGEALFKAGNTATIQLHNTSNYLYGDINNDVQLIAGASGSVVVKAGGSGGVRLNTSATAWVANSDETLKENIKPLENVLDKIKNYQCIEYNLKSDDTKGKKIGFIAQDWENDFAPIVSKDDEGLLGMKYTETIPVLLKAVQELKAEIELLKAR